MSPIVVCFSGRIAIGKTSASKALAEKLSCPWAGFGDYVRAVAVKRGLNPEDRDQLQNLGESIIRAHGFDWFCKEVIAAANWSGDCPLVVDGIRHVEAFQTIGRLLPSHRTVLIHLKIDSEEALGARFAERGVGFEKRAKWESHSTERQVLSTLPTIANLVVSADLTLDEITAQIISFLTKEAAR
jgi:hypothetical protein